MVTGWTVEQKDLGWIQFSGLIYRVDGTAIYWGRNHRSRIRRWGWGWGNVDDVLTLASFLMRHPEGYKDLRVRVGDLNKWKGRAAYTVCQFPSLQEEIILGSKHSYLKFTAGKAIELYSEDGYHLLIVFMLDLSANPVSFTYLLLYI